MIIIPAPNLSVCLCVRLTFSPSACSSDCCFVFFPLLSLVCQCLHHTQSPFVRANIKHSLKWKCVCVYESHCVWEEICPQGKLSIQFGCGYGEGYRTGLMKKVSSYFTLKMPEADIMWQDLTRDNSQDRFLGFSKNHFGARGWRSFMAVLLGSEKCQDYFNADCNFDELL